MEGVQWPMTHRRGIHFEQWLGGCCTTKTLAVGASVFEKCVVYQQVVSSLLCNRFCRRRHLMSFSTWKKNDGAGHQITNLRAFDVFRYENLRQGWLSSNLDSYRLFKIGDSWLMVSGRKQENVLNSHFAEEDLPAVSYSSTLCCSRGNLQLTISLGHVCPWIDPSISARGAHHCERPDVGLRCKTSASYY
ncbi:hypothetical protein SISSUDRAFT_440105 [Sistotremastrum suecicum HHB10207 ss-3]|uniref:Uncharacterized protein n=1 Tax=Sistotremastrum suecicum HHB10207 ss-3 TaxID=1314776 RepID=A0A166FJT6_9AGAM|nr:hypothetical protein SISSUDRAFT_440105 [Sistotremastrum suecicum HHB10207 ss-3]